MRCNICYSGGGSIELKHGMYGYYYICMNCGAKVGCHKGTTKPLGIFADTEMQQLRKECHRLIDSRPNGVKRWTTAKERTLLYKKLSSQMGIPSKDCHFAKMDKNRLLNAKAILNEWR